MLEVMAGFDARCTESRRSPAIVDRAPSTGRLALAGVRIGIIANFDKERIQPDVSSGFSGALDRLRQLGAEIVILDLPFFDSNAARRAAFVAVEVGAALAYGDLYAREPERFSAEMRGYLDWGRKAAALQFLKADRIMDATAFALARAFEQAEVIASPATPQVAFPFGAKVPDNQGAFCVAANMAGSPAISVPMGLAANGLPMGLQLMAPVFAEKRLLQIAEAYEAAAGRGAAPPAPYGPV